MSLSKLEGRITAAAAWTMTVAETGGTGATVTGLQVAAAGDYYLTSTTALLAAIGTALTSSALVCTYTLTQDDDTDGSTGKITITAAPGGTGVTSVAITWVGTELRNLLGWAGNLSGSLSYTAPAASPYLYLPSCARGNPPCPDADAGLEVTDGTLAIAPSGASVALQYQTRYVNSLEYPLLLGTRTFTSLESGGVSSLQSFWRSVIGVGKPFRYHSDRATDGTYATWRADAEALHAFAPVPHRPGWTGATSLWGWRCGVIAYV